MENLAKLIGRKAGRFKRRRSTSRHGDDDGPPLKTLKQDPQQTTDSMKRARSPSLEADSDERPSKSLKPDGDEGEGQKQHVDDGFDLGGATITNLRFLSVDEYGNEFELTLAVKTEGLASDIGLPTPDPTPLPTDGDPFDKTRAAPAIIGAPHSPANFAYVGDMRLFGLIPSKVYVYQHISDDLHPYDEVIKIAHGERISLGALWPSLQGSDWDIIALEDPILGFQETAGVGGPLGRQSGLYFETDVVFQGALQPVSDFLKDFFHQEKPAIRMSTWLSQDRRYGQAFKPASFVLRGSMQHVSVNLLDILTFREIGIELTGHQIYNMTERKNKWSFGYGFFGKLDLNVPRTAVPLQVEYYLRQSFKSWILQLRLKDDEWNDIFGVKGLKLTDVLLQARLDHDGSKINKFSFGIEADLELRKSKFGICGYYSKDFYSIEGFLGDLTLHDVGEIFQELVGIELDLFSYDIVFRSMSICVSSDGLELTGEVTINGHTSTSGSLKLSGDGIAVYGSIGDIEFEHVLIREASLDVFIASKLDTHCARASRVNISGDVCVHGVELKAALHTEKADNGEIRWTIYGEVEGDVSTSRFAPELKETFLDISLNRLALIASNHNAPLGLYKGINYPVTKGFQFCAAIDSIPELEQLMRGSVRGMTLRAAYSSGKFKLGIMLPSKRTISFGEHVYTGPLEFELQTGTDIKLILNASLNIVLDTQPEPLKLAMGIKASTIGASAYANMLNDWVNPCNVGKNIKISSCALEFGIVYTTFFTTGMPGEIGLAGQLSIGNKEAKVAMKLSQNPKEQLLAASVTDLGVVDLVRFASAIADHKFPEPDEFLHFNNVDLYLSTGTSIGTVEYPPGASLKGDMLIFGKKAKFDCTIGSLIKIMATIEQFELGPLRVKGATRTDPIVDIEISAEKQKVLIDGAVELWSTSAGLHLEAETYPQRKFDFWVDVSVSDWFKFKLEAKLTGDFDHKDFSKLANADFSIYGLMEQHILEHIVDMLDKQINSMHENSDFEETKKRLLEKETQFNITLQAAQTKLEEAKQTWQKKQELLTAELERAEAEAANYRKELQVKVEEAERSLKQLVTNAAAKLELVRHNASVAINLADSDLAHAQQDGEESIRRAQDDLYRKRDAFQIKFGSAKSDLENMLQNVQQTQAVVDSIKKDINDLDYRIFKASFWDTPTLVSERVSKTIKQAQVSADLEAAKAIFCNADALIRGTEYITVEAAIADAITSLDAATQAKAHAIKIAEITLVDVKKDQALLIESATQALYSAENNSNELSTLALAKNELIAGESMAQSIFSSAEAAINDLKTAEFLAVATAEKALASAQTNSTEVELARQACARVEEDSSHFADDIVDVGLNIGKWLASNAAETINITKIEFSGSVSSLVADGPPLIVNIQGKLLGEDIDIQINWQPHFNLVKFIKAIFDELWEIIKNATGKFLEEIGAKLVEIAEDIEEGVEKAAEVIAESAEQVADAIEDAAREIGHAAEDVAHDIDNTVSEMGNDIENAVDKFENDVGNAVDDAVNDIGNSVDDVGNAVNDFGNNVGNAVDDFENDVGNAVNDFGNAISDTFSFW